MEPMGRLLLLFILLPGVELALLIELGRAIGTPGTLLLIAVTGVIGAALARRQGLRALRDLQAESAAGRLPAAALTDGAIILVAGALLITPGLLTDATGFLCLVPAVRAWVRGAIVRRIERAIRDGDVVVMGRFESTSARGASGPIVDVAAEPEGAAKPGDRGAR